MGFQGISWKFQGPLSKYQGISGGFINFSGAFKNLQGSSWGIREGFRGHSEVLREVSDDSRAGSWTFLKALKRASGLQRIFMGISEGTQEGIRGISKAASVGFIGVPGDLRGFERTSWELHGGFKRLLWRFPGSFQGFHADIKRTLVVL